MYNIKPYKESAREKKIAAGISRGERYPFSEAWDITPPDPLLT
jgi:hypothetical protein